VRVHLGLAIVGIEFGALTWSAGSQPTNLNAQTVSVFLLIVRWSADLGAAVLHTVVGLPWCPIYNSFLTTHTASVLPCL